MPTPAERAADIRAHLEASPVDAPATPWEWEALDRRARAVLATGKLPPRVSELFLHVEGAGVVGHRLPANAAAKILETVQKAITNIGSALSQDEKRKPSRGVRKSTRFYVTPNVLPGSIVFHLDRDPEPEDDTSAQAALFEADVPAKESLADMSVGMLIGLIAVAEQDDATDAGALTERLRGLGPRTTAKLAQLAEHLTKEDLSLEFCQLSTNSQRRRSTLSKRGCSVITEAAERNKEREERVTLIGELNTTSDGHDKVRITLANESEVLLTADRETGARLGAWLTRQVRVEALRVTRWSLATGKETVRYRLLNAELADADYSEPC